MTLSKAPSQSKTEDIPSVVFSLSPFKPPSQSKEEDIPDVCSRAWTPSHRNSNVIKASKACQKSLVSSLLDKDNGVSVPVERQMSRLTMGEPNSQREMSKHETMLTRKKNVMQQQLGDGTTGPLWVRIMGRGNDRISATSIMQEKT